MNYCTRAKMKHPLLNPSTFSVLELKKVLGHLLRNESRLSVYTASRDADLVPTPRKDQTSVNTLIMFTKYFLKHRCYFDDDYVKRVKLIRPIKSEPIKELLYMFSDKTYREFYDHVVGFFYGE